MRPGFGCIKDPFAYRQLSASRVPASTAASQPQGPTARPKLPAGHEKSAAVVAAVMGGDDWGAVSAHRAVQSETSEDRNWHTYRHGAR
jgi:hypothetical protein